MGVAEGLFAGAAGVDRAGAEAVLAESSQTVILNCLNAECTTASGDICIRTIIGENLSKTAQALPPRNALS